MIIGYKLRSTESKYVMQCRGSLYTDIFFLQFALFEVIRIPHCSGISSQFGRIVVNCQKHIAQPAQTDCCTEIRYQFELRYIVLILYPKNIL